MACEESKALCLVRKKHSSKVAVSETNLTVFGNRTVDAEALQTDSDVLSSFLSVLSACLKSDSSAYAVCPAYVFKADRLNSLSNFIRIEACSLTDFTALLNRGNTVLG